jgi:hypothetical protein
MTSLYQRRLDFVMRLLLILLHGLFVAVLLTTPDDQPLLKLVLVGVGLVGAGLALYAPLFHRFQARLGRLWMAFAPFVWFVLLSSIVIWGSPRLPAPRLWSAVVTWTATIFFWWIAYWALAYFRRTFVLDAERRRDWRLLLLVTTLMCAFSLLIPYVTVTRVVIPNNYRIDRWNLVLERLSRSPQAPEFIDYVAYFNSDAYDFIYNSNTFLTGWPGNTGIDLQRPTYFIFSSQVCRLISLPYDGYASATTIPCTDQNRGMVSFWVVNLGMACVSILGIYELVRAYLGSAGIARNAALLAVMSGFTLYFFAIAATDYAELFIAIASLWLLHRLFSAPSSWRRVAAYGAAFGLLLLLKLNAIYLIFGSLLALLLWRPRLLVAFSLMPALVYGSYRLLMGALNVPYVVTEAGSQWDTIHWLLEKFPDLGWYDKARALTLFSAQVLDKTAFLFGVLLFVGVFVMILNPRFPRRVTAAGWLLFISVCAWMPIFVYTYVQHVVGLMPFMYGAVALGAEDAAARARRRFTNPDGAPARLLAGLILLAPLLINVAQWVVWGAKDWINFG